MTLHPLQRNFIPRKWLKFYTPPVKIHLPERLPDSSLSLSPFPPSSLSFSFSLTFLSIPFFTRTLFARFTSKRPPSYFSFTILLITSVLPAERLPIVVLIAHNWILQTSWYESKRKIIRFSRRAAWFAEDGFSADGYPNTRIDWHWYSNTYPETRKSWFWLNRRCLFRLLVYPVARSIKS